MFKANDNQQKLENMNIDDILEHAEDHDTTENLGGAQLGGDDFLQQFEIADYKADVSWDEIIPKQDRERIEEEERVIQEQRATEELIAMNSRRVAALSKRVNFGDTDSRASEEPERKKRKVVVKNGPKKKPEIDVDRELDINDIRHLYNGMRRFGHLEGRYEEIVAGVDLAKLKEDNVRKTGEELYDACLQAVKNHNLEKPEETTTAVDATANGEAKSKAPQKKAILIDFKSLAKVNAESILQRCDDMRFIRRVVHRATPITNFRISSQVKAVTNWKCQWAVKDDAMLLIGVDKHGHGSWQAIRDDPELGLTDKMFLDENKSEKKGAKSEGAAKDIPGSIHLSRRTDYLISALREEYRKPGILDVLSGKAIETPVKEKKPRANNVSKPSGSKKAVNGEAPSSPERKKKSSGHRTEDSDGKARKAAPKEKVRRDHAKSSSKGKAFTKQHREEVLSDYESMDEAELKVSLLCDHHFNNLD
jgi:chromodomain-helicase-DNA-binding protein 1